MRNDFDEMTAALQRPKDFRLKVRNHHGLLTITSVAKLFFQKILKFHSLVQIFKHINC
jgi:hypothetical protein